jgi:predicted transcriptional regulator
VCCQLVDRQEEREKRQLEILLLLNKNGSMRYTELQKAFISHTNESFSVFNKVLYHLVLSGRVVKSEVDFLAPYRLTEKGRLLMGALKT